MAVQLRANGDHGGRVRRRFTGAGRDWLPGDEISPAEARLWPPTNRLGLANNGFVYWYEAPEGGERLPETIGVDLGDGTIVVARLERAEDGSLIARVGQTPSHPASVARQTRSRN